MVRRSDSTITATSLWHGYILNEKVVIRNVYIKDDMYHESTKLSTKCLVTISKCNRIYDTTANSAVDSFRLFFAVRATGKKVTVSATCCVEFSGGFYQC